MIHSNPQSRMFPSIATMINILPRPQSTEILMPCGVQEARVAAPSCHHQSPSMLAPLTAITVKLSASLRFTSKSMSPRPLMLQAIDLVDTLLSRLRMHKLSTPPLAVFSLPSKSLTFYSSMILSSCPLFLAAHTNNFLQSPSIRE